MTLFLELVRTENPNQLTLQHSDNIVCTRMGNLSEAIGSNLVPREQTPSNQVF